jgi:3',5'-cyclic AMP phosphodiesterase CpdA
MILAQISDLHIKPQRRLAYGVVDTAAMLEQCVAALLQLKQRPDAVIATGDLVDLGRPEEYGLLREILAPLGSLPLYLLPGNHDERGALRAAFPEHGYLRQWEPFLQYAIEDHPLRLIGLDTVIPGQGGGELCAQRLAWLDRTLAQSDRPTVVALHHPPFVTGIGHMDRVCLSGTEGLAQVLMRHPQVTRLIAGHLHRPITCSFGGTVVSVSPSPAHLVALDLSIDAPDDFVMEPPGFLLHAQTASGLVTHTAYIGDFAGPYPFRKGGRLLD